MIRNNQYINYSSSENIFFNMKSKSSFIIENRVLVSNYDDI